MSACNGTPSPGGLPRLPPCRSGRCTSGDYQIQEFAGRYVRTCRCGTRRARRFVTINDDGSETNHLIWRPFRGRFPDA